MTEHPQLIDIGVNLTNKAFRGDFDAVLQRANEVGVTRQIVTGTTVHESRTAAKLAAEHPGQLYSTAGVHPHNAKDCDATTLDVLRELSSQPGVVAIGECGLDFNRDFSPRPQQIEWYTKQVELAIELSMPLFLHERDAAETMLSVLREFRDRISAAVVHCFTGEAETLRAYLDLDLHIGITGWICDERRGLHLRELVKEIPSDRLMIETDAPYLTPRTIRPKPKRGRNEPAFLPHVLDAVAECTGRSRADVAAETTRTAARFFALDS